MPKTLAPNTVVVDKTGLVYRIVSQDSKWTSMVYAGYNAKADEKVQRRKTSTLSFRYIKNADGSLDKITK